MQRIEEEMAVLSFELRAGRMRAFGEARASQTLVGTSHGQAGDNTAYWWPGHNTDAVFQQFDGIRKMQQAMAANITEFERQIIEERFVP